MSTSARRKFFVTSPLFASNYSSRVALRIEDKQGNLSEGEFRFCKHTTFISVDGNTYMVER